MDIQNLLGGKKIRFLLDVASLRPFCDITLASGRKSKPL